MKVTENSDISTTQSEAAIAQFTATFNELVKAGHEPAKLAETIMQTGLGAMLQLEGVKAVGHLLRVMSDQILKTAEDENEGGTIN